MVNKPFLALVLSRHLNYLKKGVKVFCVFFSLLLSFCCNLKIDAPSNSHRTPTIYLTRVHRAAIEGSGNVWREPREKKRWVTIRLLCAYRSRCYGTDPAKLKPINNI